MQELPKETFRDHLAALERALKFKYVPFRAYYKYRSRKYMERIDPEMGLIRFLTRRDRISLDVGANLGLFTHILSRHSSHVHAFEPNPLPLDILKHVADRNVTLHQVALTDRTGEVELLVPRSRRGWSSNGASLMKPSEGRYIALNVPARRIDDLGLRDIGFIKIDVEGHEGAVLRGAAETLRRDRPRLFVENEYAHVGASTEVFDFLRALDYDGFFLADGALANISKFSVEEYQIEPTANPAKRGRYVKNFIFIPK